MALQFEAAAPVVFVHGILSDGKTWSEAKKHIESKGMVADNSITLPYDPLNKSEITDPENSCEKPMFNTVNRNRKKLIVEFHRIAELYGTDELHIVGHSKGGIDAKAAIHTINDSPPMIHLGTMNNTSLEAPLKINSLITLNTPHLGAPAADLGIVKILEEHALVKDGNFNGLLGTGSFWAEQIVNHLLSKDHVCDLTLNRATEINKKYPVMVPIFATGTDAASRPNASHTLPLAEAILSPLDNRFTKKVWGYVYRYTGSTNELKYRKKTVPAIGSGTKEIHEAYVVNGAWTPNDVLVSTISAKGSNLPMLWNVYLGQHHTEVNKRGPVLESVTQQALEGWNGVKWSMRK